MPRIIPGESEWQNTNLGVSVTSILAGDATSFTNLIYTLTVSNHATYTDPVYFCEVYTGVTLVVPNSSVTDNEDGTLTFLGPAAGTHEIRVRVQDFGDLQSAISTKALTTTNFGGLFRYWRFTNWQASGSDWFMVGDLRLYTASGATGTAYPLDMTSAVLPVPYVASVLTNYNATYEEWKAFDNTTATFYWAIGTVAPLLDWLTIDLGSARDIRSFKLTAGNAIVYAPTQMEILGSATGIFAGEETSLGTFTFPGASTFEVNIIG